MHLLFRTIAIGEKRSQYRTALNSKYSIGRWEFIVQQQVGAGEWKTTKKKHQGWGDLG